MKIVSIIKNNYIEWMFEFSLIEKAEQAFVKLIKQHCSNILSEEDFEDFLDDGICECDDKTTICIGEPTTDFDVYQEMMES
jgi:hypothetical protein